MGKKRKEDIRRLCEENKILPNPPLEVSFDTPLGIPMAIDFVAKVNEEKLQVVLNNLEKMPSDRPVF